MSTNTDIVSLLALRLATTVGPDHWHRTRPQPIHLTLHLHLSPSYLDTPGRTDDVADSLHYGHLTKVVQKRIDKRAESDEEGGGYPNPRALVDDVTNAAFEFVRETASSGTIRAVRVVLELPKRILLAQGFEIDVCTPASDWAVASGRSTAGAIVRVNNLILPVLIGVNPPERLAKQHVITHLTLFESARTVGDLKDVDYPSVVQRIATAIETSTYLTLEKLVYETIRTAYRAFDDHPDAVRIDAITVRCQKPSAVSFADASAVEMTRTREAAGAIESNGVR